MKSVDECNVTGFGQSVGSECHTNPFIWDWGLSETPSHPHTRRKSFSRHLVTPVIVLDGVFPQCSKLFNIQHQESESS